MVEIVEVEDGAEAPAAASEPPPAESASGSAEVCHLCRYSEVFPSSACHNCDEVNSTSTQLTEKLVILRM